MLRIGSALHDHIGGKPEELAGLGRIVGSVDGEGALPLDNEPDGMMFDRLRFLVPVHLALSMADNENGNNQFIQAGGQLSGGEHRHRSFHGF
ncbi:Uncharacterised protein [Mycobacterium tuberculosis]|nr:Uncharacterised protein [Mycobacterium tuberculosis]